MKREEKKQSLFKKNFFDIFNRSSTTQNSSRNRTRSNWKYNNREVRDL